MVNPTGRNIPHDWPVAGRDPSGLLFEPRAFWSVGRVVTADNPETFEQEPNVIRMPRDHFRNGARWPIVLTRIAFAAINYTLREYDVTPDGTPVNYHNDGSVQSLCEVLWGLPQRQRYSQRYFSLTGLAARPTSEPSMLQDPTADFASGAWGVSRLAFDKPLVLPQSGAIEIGVGSWTQSLGITNSIDELEGWISVEELGGIWPGAARAVQKTLQPYVSDDAGIVPWPPDAFGAVATQGSSQTIDSRQQFTATEFTKRDPFRGKAGSRAFHAAQVWLNQIEFDDEVQDSLVTGVPGSPITPLALRVPVRARTRGGGTGHWWWRPNAPLGLVFNELTPATVYDLPQPITLRDGDCLDVRVRTPWRTTLDAVVQDPTYQIGVAFTGYAVING